MFLFLKLCQPIQAGLTGPLTDSDQLYQLGLDVRGDHHSDDFDRGCNDGSGPMLQVLSKSNTN